MKNLIIIIFSITLFSACGPKEITKLEALELITKATKYPREVDYDIFRSDPAHARRILDAGLETSGLVSVQKTQKLKNLGDPLVEFTSLATPFLLTTSQKQKESDVQKVRVAEEIVNGVNAIHLERKNYMSIEFTTVYHKLTPFASLLRKVPTKPISHVAYFTLSDGEWVIENTEKSIR